MSGNFKEIRTGNLVDDVTYDVSYDVSCDVNYDVSCDLSCDVTCDWQTRSHWVTDDQSVSFNQPLFWCFINWAIKFIVK